MKKWREAAEKSQEYRLKFLRELKPEHPLYHSPDAQAARGRLENSQ
jgi:hypothetical protein